MKKIFLAAAFFVGYTTATFAQTQVAKVSTVVEAEDNFNKQVAKKGIKDGFLAVADVEGIVYKPQAVKISDFYGKIDKQPGTLVRQPKFARISTNGDLAFTAGPYVYQNGKKEEDKVYGHYVSLWRGDGDGKLKLLIDLGIQHPEPEVTETTDFRDPAGDKKVAASKDPFAGKNLLISTDKTLNVMFSKSALASYKEFLSPEARYYFPGFEPIAGSDKIMKFVNNQDISITAETVNGGRATSNDLAYTYGKARIKKGNIVSNYNYVRIWEIDAAHKWNILLEVFSAIENE